MNGIKVFWESGNILVPERPFSMAGNVKTAKRSALEPENVEKLLILHDNLPPVRLAYQQTK